MNTLFQPFLFSLLILAGLFACKSSATYAPTAEVTYLANPNPGLVSLQSTGYGNSEISAEHNAYVQALNTILFKGLPAFTALRTPMIPNESKARAEHSAYFKKLYDDKGYLQFVTKRESPKFTKASDGQGKVATQNLTINYESLRRDLEQNGVIRKFGL